MLKKLGKSITIVNAVAFTVVILVGGISIFLTKDILHNAYKIKEESEHIAVIDSIHTDSYRLVLAMHHFLIDADTVYSQEVISLISSIRSRLKDYRAEEAAELYKEKNQEIKLLDTVLSDIENLAGVSKFFEDFIRTGQYDRDELIGLEEFAYELENATKQINQIHFEKISGWTGESLRHMWVILILYLVFITLGGLSIYGGHIILLKKVVNPIKDLASATVEFAEGQLDKRVYTDSRTEIGQLFQSFNNMAKRLQENDDILRKFNEELEKKVRERTVELQKANEQLQKTQKALIRTEKAAAVGQIAAGVTHEIKNPLNSLSINTQMLMRELSGKFGLESSEYESASLIRHEIDRINNILEEFVKFAKFPEPRLNENNMNSVIKEVVDLISESARDSNITISLSLQEDIPLFRFDARQFKEVLINLFQNAIRAMQARGAGELSIKTAIVEDNVMISVSDNGEGISEKNLGRIFSPFFSTREKGLGLGLSIVQRIVESHGGKIVCRSRPGEGTEFEIVLPLERG